MNTEIPANIGPETAAPGQSLRKAGKYVHKHTGKVLFALNEQQADAFERLEFVFERELRDGDIFVPAYEPEVSKEEKLANSLEAVATAIAAQSAPVAPAPKAEVEAVPTPDLTDEEAGEADAEDPEAELNEGTEGAETEGNE